MTLDWFAQRPSRCQVVGGAIGTDSIGIIVIIVSGYLGQINLEVYLSFNQKNTQVYQCYSVLASTFKKEVFLVQPFKFRLTLSRLSLTFWIEKVKGLQDSSVQQQQQQHCSHYEFLFFCPTVA